MSFNLGKLSPSPDRKSSRPMHDYGSSFLRGEADDSASLPEVQSLKTYHDQIKAIYEWLSFEDQRHIDSTSIDTLDQQLRAILKGIYSLQQMHDLSLFLISYDAIHNWVGQARQNLYRVSAILEKPKISNKDQEERFKLLADCPRLLAEALEYFNI